MSDNVPADCSGISHMGGVASKGESSVNPEIRKSGNVNSGIAVLTRVPANNN